MNAAWGVDLRDGHERRRQALLSVAIAVISMIVMLALAASDDPRRVVAGDAHYLFAAARSLAYDGDLDLTNQYLVMGDRWGLGRDPAADGWRLPVRELGGSLIMIPGLWLHRGLGLAPQWEPACACLVSAASLGLCWLGCVRCLLAVCGGGGGGGGAGAAGTLSAIEAEVLAAAAILGFVLPYYAWIAAGYNHAADAAICAGLSWSLCARRRGLIVGLLLACAVAVRLQNALFVLWPLAEIARADASERRQAAIRAATIAGVGLIGALPQLWLGLAHPGSARGAWGWTLGFFDLRDYGLDLVRVLLGHHGLLRETPIAGLALVGLAGVGIGVGVWRRGPDDPATAPGQGHGPTWGPVVTLAALWLLFASVRDVDGGDAFGARRFAGCAAILSVGLGALWRGLRARTSAGTHHGPRALALLGLVIATLVGANLWRCYEAATGSLSIKGPAPTTSASSPARKSSPSQR